MTALFKRYVAWRRLRRVLKRGGFIEVAPGRWQK